jgi:hypothetical protein
MKRIQEEIHSDDSYEEGDVFETQVKFYEGDKLINEFRNVKEFVALNNQLEESRL